MKLRLELRSGSPESRMLLTRRLEVVERSVIHLKSLLGRPGRTLDVEDEMGACMIEIYEFVSGAAPTTEVELKKEPKKRCRSGQYSPFDRSDAEDSGN